MSSEEVELDFSGYISYHAMASNTLSLFMGFTFTSIVVMLTLVPNPNELRIQTVLFFLSLLFQILGFLLFVEEATLAYCVRVAPKLPKDYKGSVVHALSNFVWYMLTGIIVLMFVVFDLILIAVTAAVIGVFFIVMASKIAQPFYKVAQKWVRR